MRNIYFYIVLPVLVAIVVLVCFYKLTNNELPKHTWHFDKEFSITFGHQVGHLTHGLTVETSEAVRLQLGETYLCRYLVTNNSDQTYDLQVKTIAYPSSYGNYTRTINSNIPTQLSLEPGTQVELFVYGYVDPELLEATDPKNIPHIDKMYYKIQLYTEQEIAEKAAMEERLRESEIKAQNEMGWHNAPL